MTRQRQLYVFVIARLATPLTIASPEPVLGYSYSIAMFLTIVLTECQKNGFYLGKSDRISFFWDLMIRQGTEKF